MGDLFLFGKHGDRHISFDLIHRYISRPRNSHSFLFVNPLDPWPIVRGVEGLTLKFKSDT